METVTFYLIEDNIGYQMDLKNIIKKYHVEYSDNYNYRIIIVQNYNKFFETIDHQSINFSDIFIIDIQLNTYFTGIDLGQKIRALNKDCKIVYLSVLSDKAIEAINNQVSPDAYLLKSDCLDVTQMQLFDLFNSFKVNNETPNKTMIVTSRNIDYVLNPADVLFISTLMGHRNKLKIKTFYSELLITGTLSKMKSKVPSTTFCTNLKSIIINYANIKSISAIEQTITFKNDFELTLNTKLIYKIIAFMKK